MEAMAWAMKQPISPVSRKYVLTVLGDKANEEYRCWPKQEVIAEIIGITVRMVKKHIHALVADGYLIIERHGPKGNVYTLSVKGNVATPDHAERGTPVPVFVDTVVPLSNLEKGNSSAWPEQGERGTPVPQKGNSSTAPSLLTQSNPKIPTAAAATRAHVREGPAWLIDLYRLGWAEADPLTDRDTDRLIADFGSLDLADEIELFRAYWSRKGKPPGKWNTYLRLRTWLRNAQTGFKSDRRTDKQPGYGKLPRTAGDLSIAANA